MKTDLYTKGILTLIAACLVVLVLRPLALVPTAAATAASGRTYGLVPVNADGSLTVRLLASETMKVAIVGIRKPNKANTNAASDIIWDAINTAK
ncbi:MAG: hypothetical protein M3Y54_02415 [Bacteroidota bacterium]|nr:hypothetical protein [Bacteroidota bacterium]